MTDSVDRFSNRVANYVKYRPGYPPEVLELFKSKMDLTKTSVIADVGSGPGILTRLFLENGNVAFGVEPNEGMRRAAEEILKDFPNFRSVDGTAETTGLPDASVDIVTAGQAFHWFKAEAARKEFKRILRSGGWCALIWNMRQLDSTPFLREYEQFIVDNAIDYEEVRHERIAGPLRDSPARSADPSDKLQMAGELIKFFTDGFEYASFDNIQIFDFDGLKGRLFSSSYMPAEETERGQKIALDLHQLFARHEREGRIEVLYDTNIFYGQL